MEDGKEKMEDGEEKMESGRRGWIPMLMKKSRDF
jgi:hypothetical protein